MPLHFSLLSEAAGSPLFSVALPSALAAAPASKPDTTAVVSNVYILFVINTPMDSKMKDSIVFILMSETTGIFITKNLVFYKFNLNLKLLQLNYNRINVTRQPMILATQTDHEKARVLDLEESAVTVTYKLMWL